MIGHSYKVNDSVFIVTEFKAEDMKTKKKNIFFLKALKILLFFS